MSSFERLVGALEQKQLPLWKRTLINLALLGLIIASMMLPMVQQALFALVFMGPSLIMILNYILARGGAVERLLWATTPWLGLIIYGFVLSALTPDPKIRMMNGLFFAVVIVAVLLGVAILAGWVGAQAIRTRLNSRFEDIE